MYMSTCAWVDVVDMHVHVHVHICIHVADGPFGKRLRSRRLDQQTTPTDKGRVEFQGFQLRKTGSQEQRERGKGYGGGYDFGVKLRVSGVGGRLGWRVCVCVCL